MGNDQQGVVDARLLLEWRPWVYRAIFIGALILVIYALKSSGIFIFRFNVMAAWFFFFFFVIW